MNTFFQSQQARNMSNRRKMSIANEATASSAKLEKRETKNFRESIFFITWHIFSLSLPNFFIAKERQKCERKNSSFALKKACAPWLAPVVNCFSLSRKFYIVVLPLGERLRRKITSLLVRLHVRLGVDFMPTSLHYGRTIELALNTTSTRRVYTVRWEH